MDPIEIIAKLGVNYVPFLFALCFHELAHGWVAKKKGDNTAELMGRLTMSPFAHADLAGTFLVPIFAILTGFPFFFGWAKPVPVNERNLSHPKKDMFWIALAGPMSNLLLAFICSVMFVSAGVLLMYSPYLTSVQVMLNNFVGINLMLCVFNLIPIHPLDGGKILARFIPHDWNNWLEQNATPLNIGFIGFMVLGGNAILAYPIRFLLLGLSVAANTVVGLFV